ncbi:MAG: ABC transporter ATP-binding protein [Pedosphaera sp.]|nr:ABC transporter ATP-binding protein [Pedosphaera sp.]
MPDSLRPILQIRNVRKAYGSRTILAGISLDIAAGERLALTGPSGSGKTTLLNLLGGVDRPDSGLIEFDGRDINSLNNSDLTALRRTSFGIIFQFFHLLPTLTAAENVELPLQLNQVPAAERVNRVNQLLDRVGVSHRANAFPGELSGGEMQRVSIARAIAHKPRLLLADEPTGNLDSKNGASVLELLREVSEETRTALVLVTHSPAAAAICHREIRLLDGLIFREINPFSRPS